MRRFGLAIVVLALFLGGTTAQATWTPKLSLLEWMNADRQGPDLVLGWRLSKMARENNVRMANAGALSHSSLPDGYYGENVGVVQAGHLRDMYDAFMRSRPHRVNILDPRFRRVGIGVLARDGFLWVTIIFKG